MDKTSEDIEYVNVVMTIFTGKWVYGLLFHRYQSPGLDNRRDTIDQRDLPGITQP